MPVESPCRWNRRSRQTGIAAPARWTHPADGLPKTTLCVAARLSVNVRKGLQLAGDSRGQTVRSQ